MKTRHLKKIDRILGRGISRLFSALPVQADEISPPRRILFVRPGGLGDALLLLPTIETLAAALPDAEIDILAEPRNQAAFTFLTIQHRVELYTNPGAFFRLRNRGYDLVIDTEQWYRLSAIYARLLQPHRLIGFATNERTRLFSDPVAYDLNEYERQSFFRLLGPLGIVVSQSAKNSRLSVAEDVLSTVGKLLPAARGEGLVAVFPGASVAEKCWPKEYYCQIIEALQGKAAKVVLVGGKTEQAVASEIATSTGCSDLTGRTSLQETAGILTMVDLLITGDSALLHLAASLETPTLSLFGPTSADKWAPPGRGNVCLQVRFDCVPCARYGHIPACPHQQKCMTELKPEMVLAAVEKLLFEETVAY